MPLAPFTCCTEDAVFCCARVSGERVGCAEEVPPLSDLQVVHLETWQKGGDVWNLYRRPWFVNCCLVGGV